MSLVIRFMHEDEPQSEIKNKTVPEVRNRLNLALSQAETATGTSLRWIRETGANILKITIPLEKEVASGSINVSVASEIARIDEPEIQARFVEHAKSGLHYPIIRKRRQV